MSNRVTFQLTMFQDIEPSGLVKHMAYGWRVYDDIGQTYSNVAYETKEELLAVTPEDALAVIKELSSKNEAMVDVMDVVTNRGGFYFNDIWIEVDSNGVIAKERNHG